jgi:hypothetical protein
MKKYINFANHQAFKPMWNPHEMLEAGIHSGKPFDKHPRQFVVNLFPKLGDIPENISFRKKASAKINYFGVTSDHGDFDAVKWFKWYNEFYYNHLTHGPDWKKDKEMMAIWCRQLWKVWDEIFKTKDILTKKYTVTDVQKQTLLELAWNFEYEPNFTKEWMFQQFPLPQ